MADEKTINTRIQLKYDTLENWTAANPVLKAGEVAIVAIPTDTESTVEQVTKPAIVFKVGDGTSNFNSLPYASGLAADVYAWAKAEEKPSYSVSEITDWNTSVDEEVSSLITSALTDLLESENFASAVIKDVTQTVEGSLQTAESYTDTSIAGLAGENGVSVTSGNYITGISVKESTEEEIEAGASKYVLKLAEEALPKTDLTGYCTREEVNEKLEKKQDTLTFDTEPTEGSTNPVTSGGVLTAISNAIDGVTQFDFQVVDELPDEGVKGVIYLLECKDETHSHNDNNDVYDEYIWMDNKWEKIGNTAIDLDSYATLSGLEQEITDRENADNELQESIDALSSDLETEVKNREDGDSTLQSSIDSLSEEVNTTIQESITSIESELATLEDTVNTTITESIEKIEEELDNKQDKGDYVTNDVLNTTLEDYYDKETVDEKIANVEVDIEKYEVATDENSGLTVTTDSDTEKGTTKFTIGIDDNVVFVFNCGNATLEN